MHVILLHCQPFPIMAREIIICHSWYAGGAQTSEAGDGVARLRNDYPM